jgi:hypothetical protein
VFPVKYELNFIYYLEEIYSFRGYDKRANYKLRNEKLRDSYRCCGVRIEKYGML